MRSRAISLVAAASVVLATLAFAVPVPPKRLPPVITPRNAAQVRPVGEVKQDVWEIVWGPRPSQVSLLSWEAPVKFLDVDTLAPVRTIGARLRLIHFATSADENVVAWCENLPHIAGKAQRWEFKVQDLRTDKTSSFATTNHQPQMTFSPDGKFVASGGYGTQAHLWIAATGKLVRPLASDCEGGLTPAFSPDSKVLALGNRNSTARLYDVATGKLLHVLPQRMSQELRFSPDGDTLAVAYVDGSIALWEVSTGKLLHGQKTAASELFTLDWSPRGDVLATAGLNGMITLWDPQTMKALNELEAPEWVIKVRFSPDGRRLLSAGGTAVKSPDRKVVIWGVSSPTSR